MLTLLPEPTASQVPEPPSPSYRTRVPKLSPTNRSHHVKHVPGQHIFDYDRDRRSARFQRRPAARYKPVTRKFVEWS